MRASRWSTVLMLGSLSLVAACATMRVHPVQMDVSVPGAVRIAFGPLDSKLFKLQVYNESQNQTLFVNLDAVMLCHKGKERRRQPGGGSATYLVEPGRSYDVSVKFAMQDVDPNQSLWLCFGDTVSMSGTPIDLDPVELHVELPPE
jgi:hypothetical protein